MDRPRAVASAEIVNIAPALDLIRMLARGLEESTYAVSSPKSRVKVLMDGMIDEGMKMGKTIWGMWGRLPQIYCLKLFISSVSMLNQKLGIHISPSLAQPTRGLYKILEPLLLMTLILGGDVFSIANSSFQEVSIRKFLNTLSIAARAVDQFPPDRKLVRLNQSKSCGDGGLKPQLLD